jgi:hypothetical protein
MNTPFDSSSDSTDQYEAITLACLTVDSREAQRMVVPAPMAVTPGVRAMTRPDAVLLVAPHFDEARLSAFERQVFALIDGLRPVARLGIKAGLSRDDVAVAVAMLASKGAVMLGGVARQRDEDAIRSFDRELDRDTEEWHPVRPAAEPRGVGARGAIVVIAPGQRARRVA